MDNFKLAVRERKLIQEYQSIKVKFKIPFWIQNRG